MLVNLTTEEVEFDLAPDSRILLETAPGRMVARTIALPPESAAIVAPPR